MNFFFSRLFATHRLRAAGLALLGFGTIAAAFGQGSWTTRDHDNNRTGANMAETVLTPTNVNPGQFGKLFTRTVDGQIYAQPLVIAGVNVAGKGPMTLVYIATMHDGVYAFDAEHGANAAPIWQRSFINPAKNITPVPFQYLTGFGDIHPEIGIVSTPAVDVPNNTIFVVTKTLEGDPNLDSSYHQRLHVLDMSTGADKTPAIELAATVTGTGDGSVSGKLSYNARRQNQRPALVLSNGRLFIASASHGDTSPYHGWIICYDAKTYKLLGSYCSTPNGGLGGFWMSGHGMPVDANGFLYPVSGNGDYNPSAGEYGDSLLKINSTTLKVADSFTPYDQGNMDAWDLDYGSCGAVLIPGTKLVVSGGKEGKIFLNNTDKLGAYDGVSDNNIVQWFWACNGEMTSTPVFFNGIAGNQNLYAWSDNDVLKGFKFKNGVFQTSPFATGDSSDGNPSQGSYLSISSNGTNASSAIVWANAHLSGNANWDTTVGVLRAYRATDLKEIWNSETSKEDHPGFFAKMNPPVIVNGKVYLATFSNELAVYGELPPQPPTPPRSLVAQSGDNEVALTWLNSRGAASFQISRGPVGGPYVKLATVTGSPFFDDTTAKDGQMYAYVVSAGNAYGMSPTSNVVVATPAKQTGGVGTGIPAVYYNDDVLPHHFVSPALRRTDATINFDWGTNQPDPTVQQTLFSVAWTGEIVAPTTGLYTLETISDDGVRLWVNGGAAIDNWNDHAPTSDFTAPILMIAGKHYPIQMEMYQNAGGAVAKLLWSGPGSTQFDVVPTTALFAPSASALPNTGSVWLGNSYNLDGISTISNPGDGNMSLHQSLAAELLPAILPASPSFSGGLNFVLGSKLDGQNNVVQCDGSTIMTAASTGMAVQMLGLSTSGDQSGAFTLVYSDGSTGAVTTKFTDWGAAGPLHGEGLAARYSRRHSTAGFVNRPTSLFWYTLPVDASKRLIAVTLPNNPNIKLLAVTLK